MSGQPFSLEQLRPSQLSVIADYQGGRMGISAVPGSGKTHTLSYLAADIILAGNLDLDQEVLIVTLTNSAVNNFSQRIAELLKSDGSLPGMNYRVRTLHSLAHDIVRERPGLVNLADDFSIIDETEANKIRTQAAEAWLRANPGFLDRYLKDDLGEYQYEKVRGQLLPNLVGRIASSFIRYAKDYELAPAALRQQLDGMPDRLELAEMGCAIYQEYQRSLAYRGAVDFDDLIRLALLALRTDQRLVDRLHNQWPYILEDEAQDSSRLQEEILRILTGEDGNWVRVGDPNQAIYETFTTANPRHLLDFINRPGTLRKELPVSGRSMPCIIDLANFLIGWTRSSHPVAEVRDALHLPEIQPTTPGDPQPNPLDAPEQVELVAAKMTSAEEMDFVTNSLVRWQLVQDEMPAEARETLVVLDYRNDRGAALAEKLRKHGLMPVEILGTTPSTRQSAGALTHYLRYLANPRSSALLAKLLTVWRRGDRGDDEAMPAVNRAATLIRSLKCVEDFLYPLPGSDWLEETGLRTGDPDAYLLLEHFRLLVRRWHAAALLPIDQVILTIAQDLFTEPAELAIAYKLAGVLRQKSDNHPAWRLPELTGELEAVAKNERRFLGFSDDDGGFDPKNHRGRVVITTMHKAKGLEWDRVYLLSVNNYDFPSGMEYDQYISERWFIRGRMNLEAETLNQVDIAFSGDEYTWYEEGRATIASRLDTVRERLRLLYVAITRARKALVVTWNNGRNGDQQAALPLLEMQSFWQNRQAG